ncbi:MAG: hypothetical protein QM483_10230 [Desulfuromusa sp.]
MARLAAAFSYKFFSGLRISFNGPNDEDYAVADSSNGESVNTITFQLAIKFYLLGGFSKQT